MKKFNLSLKNNPSKLRSMIPHEKKAALNLFRKIHMRSNPKSNDLGFKYQIRTTLCE